MIGLITSTYWISLCVYHEARGEPEEGQILVAQTILNRSEQRKESVKKVIFEPHQFSWTDDGKSDAVDEHTAFINCIKSTLATMFRRTLGDTADGVNLYHKYTVTPSWARSPKTTYLQRVGKHLFYYEKMT